MIYQRDEVIKKGEKAIKKKKRNFIFMAFIFILCGILSIASLIIFPALQNMKDIFMMIAVFILFGFLAFMCFYLRNRKPYDPLFEGCKAIKKEIDVKYNKLNQKIVNKAKKLNKSTGKPVAVSKHRNKFEYKKLYKLLLKSDMAEYVGFEAEEDNEENSQIIEVDASEVKKKSRKEK